jgi:signal peptide peptidase SppA
MAKKHPTTGCRPSSLLGAWAIEPQRFRRMYDVAIGVDLAALAERRRQAMLDADGDDDGDELPYELLDYGIARICISGPMSKYTTSFDCMFGGCSTLMIRNAVRAASRDNNVAALLLDIDSPGGTVSGTPELADEVYAFRQAKPVIAYCSDLCCSAAYWVAAQADQIHTSSVGFVGNIGCYSVLEDSSGAQEKQGYKLTTVASAAFKGLGADGRVTETLIEETQREVSQIHDLFVQAVARGRETDAAAVATIADGRAYIGASAVAVGLADRVCTIDESVQFLIDFLTAPASAAAS